jgi:hypothetical protein
MRKFLLLVALGVLAWIFMVPSCSTKFGCESASATAHADDGSCPESLDGAAHDQGWAAQRIASLPQREEGDSTHGLLYDSDGNETSLESGESGPEYETAKDLLPMRSKQAAGHVEAKAAAALRTAEEDFGVLVINNEPCDYASGVGCAEASALILSSGSTMVIWWPGGRTVVRGKG